MKHSFKKIVLATALTGFPVLSCAGTMTGGATMPEQLVQEVTLIQSKVTQAEQLVNMIQRYENMIQNMVTLPQKMLDQVMQPIDQLYGLVQQAEALSTAGANIANQFQNLHATFNPQITAEYTQQYESITEGLNKAIDTALKSANLNPDEFQTQAQAQQAVAKAMQNPNSRNAILQAATEVGQATNSAIVQLQQTTQQYQTMQAAWRKKQLMQQEEQKEVNQKMNNDLNGTGQTPTYHLPSFSW